MLDPKTMVNVHHSFALVVVFVLIVGSGCTKSPGRVARQPSHPVIPSHNKARHFVGEWAIEGEVGIVIELDANQQLVISSPENEVWENVINNVRFVGDELHYDHYFYFIGPDDFALPGNPSGDHPFSGVCNHSVLALVDGDQDKLQSWIVSDDVDSSEKYVFERVR